MKSILQDARAHQDHQDLIVSDPRTLVHRVQAVQKAYDLLLIEERNRTKNRAPQRVLHQNAKFLFRVQRSGWAQERVLLPPINGIGVSLAFESVRFY